MIRPDRFHRIVGGLHRRGRVGARNHCKQEGRGATCLAAQPADTQQQPQEQDPPSTRTTARAAINPGAMPMRNAMSGLIGCRTWKANNYLAPDRAARIQSSVHLGFLDPCQRGAIIRTRRHAHA